MQQTNKQPYVVCHISYFGSYVEMFVDCNIFCSFQIGIFENEAVFREILQSLRINYFVLIIVFVNPNISKPKIQIFLNNFIANEYFKNNYYEKKPVRYLLKSIFYLEMITNLADYYLNKMNYYCQQLIH